MIEFNDVLMKITQTKPSEDGNFHRLRLEGCASGNYSFEITIVADGMPIFYSPKLLETQFSLTLKPQRSDQ
jgi:hypothetical protein